MSTNAQTSLYLEFRRLLDRAVRWFLTARPGRLDIGAEVERFGPVVEAMGPQVPELLRGDERKRLNRRAAEFEKSRVPEALARHTASLLDWYSLLDIVEIATDTGRDPQDVAALYYVVSERFGIDAMLGKVTRLPRDDRWDALPGVPPGRPPTRCWSHSPAVSWTPTRPTGASDPGEQYDVGPAPTRTRSRGPRGALGDRASGQPEHCRSVGRLAHPALGGPRRGGHDVRTSTAN